MLDGEVTIELPDPKIEPVEFNHRYEQYILLLK